MVFFWFFLKSICEVILTCLLVTCTCQYTGNIFLLSLLIIY